MAGTANELTNNWNGKQMEEINVEGHHNGEIRMTIRNEGKENVMQRKLVEP